MPCRAVGPFCWVSMLPAELDRLLGSANKSGYSLGFLGEKQKSKTSISVARPSRLVKASSAQCRQYKKKILLKKVSCTNRP